MKRSELAFLASRAVAALIALRALDLAVSAIYMFLMARISSPRDTGYPIAATLSMTVPFVGAMLLVYYLWFRAEEFGKRWDRDEDRLPDLGEALRSASYGGIGIYLAINAAAGIVGKTTSWLVAPAFAAKYVNIPTVIAVDAFVLVCGCLSIAYATNPGSPFFRGLRSLYKTVCQSVFGLWSPYSNGGEPR